MITKTIAIGSQNPVKINSALVGFQLMFPDIEFSAAGYEVPSLVSDQPMTNEETLRGATNRADALRTIAEQADYFVGIEGGIEIVDRVMYANAWIYIVDQSGKIARARSGAFPLPSKVQSLVESGIELGHANDQVFKEINSKHAGGAVGSLTCGVISRQQLYEHAMVLALATFRHPSLFH